MTTKANHPPSKPHVANKVNYSSRLRVLAAYIGMTESDCEEAMRKFSKENYDSIEERYFAENPQPTGKPVRHPKKEHIMGKVKSWWDEGTRPQEIGHYVVLEFFKVQCAAKKLEFDPRWFDLPLYPDLRKIPELAKAINLTFGYYSAFDSYRLYSLKAGNQADENRYNGFYKIWRIRSDNTLVNDVLHVQGSENGALCCTLYRYSPRRSVVGNLPGNDDKSIDKDIKKLSGNVFLYGNHFYAILSHEQSNRSPEPVFLLYPSHVVSDNPSIGIHSCIIDGGAMPLSGTFLIYRLDEADQPGFNIKPCIRHVKVEELETEAEKLDAERYRKMLECNKNSGPSFIRANPDSLNK